MNVRHVASAAFEFIEGYYNRPRIRRGLGYLTADEYETQTPFTLDSCPVWP